MTEAPKRIWEVTFQTAHSITKGVIAETIDPLQGYATKEDVCHLAAEHERLMAERDAEILRLRTLGLKSFTVVEWVAGVGPILDYPHYDADDLLLEMADILDVQDSIAARTALGDDNG